MEDESRKKVVLPLFQHLHQEMAKLFQLRKEFWEMLQVTFSLCLTDANSLKRPQPHVKGKGRPPKALSGEPKIVRGLKTDACHPGEFQQASNIKEIYTVESHRITVNQ